LKFCIIVSKKDLAGLNIKNNLLKKFKFKKKEHFYTFNNIVLYTVEDESFNCNNIDKEINADLFIFATRHQSSKGVHSLSIHAPGNWSNANLGGLPNKLCIAPASYIKQGLIILNKLASHLNYEITVEQTHHGPYIDKPCFFIEIGSNEKQWQDSKSGEIIAKTIMQIIKSNINYKASIFLGGGHYNHQANKILLNTNYAIGHICAKHSLVDMDEEMLKYTITRTSEKIDLIILDWKGLGKNKSKIIQILEKLNLKYERSKHLLK
jgi:D-aminoacyl-tRNA deacylase